jgi:hypothetical protein
LPSLSLLAIYKITSIGDNILPLLLKHNSFPNILKILKLAMHQVDANIIYQGLIQAFKNSKHLYVVSSSSTNVSQKSVYNAEIYKLNYSQIKDAYYVDFGYDRIVQELFFYTILQITQSITNTYLTYFSILSIFLFFAFKF